MMRHWLKLILAGVLVFGGSGSLSWSQEDEDLRSEMRMLKARMAELEAKLEQSQRSAAVKSPVSHADHAYGHDHARDGFDIQLGHQHHHLDIHNIGVHGGIDWRWVNSENSEQKMFLHEAEIGVSARLAEWFEAMVTLTKHEGEEVEVEQAYGKLKFEEFQSVVRVGKFFVNFGPENRAGFYDRRTVTPSAMRDGFFGHENWADEGLEASFKLPVEFESVVTVAGLNGNNAKTFGDGTDTVSNNNIVTAVNFHNFFKTALGGITLGSSYAGGKWDDNDDYEVHLYGIDAGWKRGSWEAQAEYMYREKESASGGTVTGDGFYVFGAYTQPLEWKYLRDIEILLAYGESDPNESSREKRVSPQLTFGLTENAKIRLIYEFREEKPVDTENDRFIAQFAYHF